MRPGYDEHGGWKSPWCDVRTRADLALKGIQPARVRRPVEDDGLDAEPDGPLSLAADDAAALRDAGHDPDVLARMHEVHSLADYRALKAAVVSR